VGLRRLQIAGRRLLADRLLLSGRYDRVDRRAHLLRRALQLLEDYLLVLLLLGDLLLLLWRLLRLRDVVLLPCRLDWLWLLRVPRAEPGAADDLRVAQSVVREGSWLDKATSADGVVLRWHSGVVRARQLLELAGDRQIPILLPAVVVEQRALVRCLLRGAALRQGHRCDQLRLVLHLLLHDGRLQFGLVRWRQMLQLSATDARASLAHDLLHRHVQLAELRAHLAGTGWKGLLWHGSGGLEL
jgi:hypothetical protein